VREPWRFQNFSCDSLVSNIIVTQNLSLKEWDDLFNVEGRKCVVENCKKFMMATWSDIFIYQRFSIFFNFLNVIMKSSQENENETTTKNHHVDDVWWCLMMMMIWKTIESWIAHFTHNSINIIWVEISSCMKVKHQNFEMLFLTTFLHFTKWLSSDLEETWKCC
jgi:hypothetical protein